jgi:hypothetical protein
MYNTKNGIKVANSTLTDAFNRFRYDQYIQDKAQNALEQQTSSPGKKSSTSKKTNIASPGKKSSTSKKTNIASPGKKSSPGKNLNISKTGNNTNIFNTEKLKKYGSYYFLRHKYEFKGYPIKWYQFCDADDDTNETIKWYDIQEVVFYFNNVHELPNDKPLPYNSKYYVQNYYTDKYTGSIQLSSTRSSATREESEAYASFLKILDNFEKKQMNNVIKRRNVEPYVYVPPKKNDVGPYSIHDNSGNLYFFKIMTHDTWSTWHEIQKGTNENGTIKEKPSDEGWKKIERKL